MDERYLLEKIRERSRIFDLETGGREADLYPVIEGGVLDLKTGKLRRTVFNPGMMVNRQWKAMDPKNLPENVSPWARRMLESDQPWGGFMAESKQDPTAWFARNITGPVSKGEWVWAHNARFDLGFLAQNLESQEYQNLISSPVGKLLSRPTIAERKFHVTGGFMTHRTLQMARANPERAEKFFVQSWDHFKDVMAMAAENKRQGLFVDSQYVIQVALAQAQEAGYVRRTHDVFTGTSLEAYRWAFGPERKWGGEAHTVSQDVRVTEGVISDYLGLIEDIRYRRGLTPTQRTALRFHEELQPRLFPENFRSQLLEARKSLLEVGKFEYYNLGGVKEYSERLRDLVNIYKPRQTTFGYAADLEGIYQQVKNLNIEQVDAQILEKDERVKRVMERAWAAAQKPARREFDSLGWRQLMNKVINPIRNRPVTSLALGSIGVMGAMALAPTKKKSKDPMDEREWLRNQQLDPNQYATLVQDLNNHKINHYKTNGY